MDLLAAVDIVPDLLNDADKLGLGSLLATWPSFSLGNIHSINFFMKFSSCLKPDSSIVLHHFQNQQDQRK